LEPRPSPVGAHHRHRANHRCRTGRDHDDGLGGLQGQTEDQSEQQEEDATAQDAPRCEDAHDAGDGFAEFLTVIDDVNLGISINDLVFTGAQPD
jgi:hypothetical protein